MTRPNRKTTRLPGFDYSTEGAYFLTICTENRKCLLSHITRESPVHEPKTELLPYGRIAEHYIRQLSDFYEELQVKAFVIMPNHIHILLFVTKGPSGTPVPTLQNSTVSRFISTLKRFCNKEIGRNIWQYRSYDHIIRDQEDFRKHLQYIQENPFGWEKDVFYSAE